MKAIPYDAENKFGGDHELYVPDSEVDYHEGDSFETLLARFDAKRFEGLDGEALIEEAEFAIEIAGFWILTEKDFETVGMVWPDGDCGRDSHVYQCNHAAKLLAAKLAIAEALPERLIVKSER